MQELYSENEKRILNLDDILIGDNIKYYKYNMIKERKIHDFQPILMSRFFSKNHCTLSSITAILKYYNKVGFKAIPDDIDEIFKMVEGIARNNSFFFPKLGTAAFFIPAIVNRIWKKLNYKGRAKNKFIFLDYNSINKKFIEELDSFHPVVLSLADGLYKNHSVTIYGYKLVEYGNGKKLIGIVNDNWSLGEKYIDLTNLGKLSSSLFIMSTFSPV